MGGQVSGLDEASDCSGADPHEVGGVIEFHHCLGQILHFDFPLFDLRGFRRGMPLARLGALEGVIFRQVDVQMVRHVAVHEARSCDYRHWPALRALNQVCRVVRPND